MTHMGIIQGLRAVFFLLLFTWTAAADEAQPAKHGLMWHRSGLPAVFPLQVKTLGPQGYYVTLTDVETERAVLAAYIEGGRFFRVLVPPGTFRVRFVYGNVWQGEEALFGETSSIFDVPEPLRFGVSGFNTKEGHLIDLRDLSPGLETHLLIPGDEALGQSKRPRVAARPWQRQTAV